MHVTIDPMPSRISTLAFHGVGSLPAAFMAGVWGRYSARCLHTPADMSTSNPLSKYPRPPFDEPHQAIPARDNAMKVKPDYGEQSYQGSGKLTGKVALVTGGDSGIGRAVALAYAREGADVAVSYLSEGHDAEVSASLVRDAGRRALLLPGDLADHEMCTQIVQRTVQEFGRIDVLVNNAAYQDEAITDLDDLTPERIERTFRVNIIAMFHTVRAALPHMSGGASIINTASVQAYAPSAAILDYAATKGAIVAFSKGLAKTTIEKGIRVNCVAPGPVWTPLIAQSFDGDKLRNFGGESPMKRPAQPAELAPAFVFLASEQASYVNGEVLGVTGGLLLG
jgi:NAD(P)-dependent dehydrogenase (short-subunit alcohol dehydrogenase family)